MSRDETPEQTRARVKAEAEQARSQIAAQEQAVAEAHEALAQASSVFCAEPGAQGFVAKHVAEQKLRNEIDTLETLRQGCAVAFAAETAELDRARLAELEAAIAESRARVPGFVDDLVDKALAFRDALSKYTRGCQSLIAEQKCFAAEANEIRARLGMPELGHKLNQPEQLARELKQRTGLDVPINANGVMVSRF